METISITNLQFKLFRGAGIICIWIGQHLIVSCYLNAYGILRFMDYYFFNGLEYKERK